MHFVSPYQTQQRKVLGATGQALSHKKKIQVLPTYCFTLWDKEKKSDLTELYEMTTIYLYNMVEMVSSKKLYCSGHKCFTKLFKDSIFSLWPKGSSAFPRR